MASFRILGPVEVSVGERRVSIGGARQLKLLSLLVLRANQAVSSDVLTDLVWGAARTRSDNRLQMAIARLRKALRPLNGNAGSRLRTVGSGYMLSLAPGELDAHVFAERVQEGRRALAAGDAATASERLSSALGLWRGPALAEVAFDDFAQSEIRRLEESRLEALECRIDADLELGAHARLVGELHPLLAEHPTRERVASQLMLALYRSQRQRDALEVYQNTRARLVEDLGLEPGPALKALQAQILEHAPALRAPATTRAAASEQRSTAQNRLPSGTVTFLFTDIEGSTKALRTLGAEAYAERLTIHRERIRAVIGSFDGVELGTEGDAFTIAFTRASDALGAAAAIQVRLADQPLRPRIGIHTGEPLIVNGDYVGLDLHRTARICAAAHGGQILVSHTTRRLTDTALRDLGEHRLKDLTAPERLFQLGENRFPPPNTLRSSNIPAPPTRTIGREREINEIIALLDDSNIRLLTLTGPGGVGKTRLALEAARAIAGDLNGRWPDGIWWVSLAPLVDPTLVLPTIAQTLGAQDDLRDHLRGRRLTVLLDNFEQVLAAAPAVSELLTSLPDLSLIVTSRERLAITFEHEFPVSPLNEVAASELFVARARQLKPGFEPDDAVVEICRRVDRLPLAVELASTRVKLMSTNQLLTRLERRLDLLTAGQRDAPTRQATMRATIDWSYDLLPQPEQALFRRLAVFAGSFELEAAEQICGAALNALQSLVDKSLLRQTADDRFYLLETTREYALGRLDAAGETGELRSRHADWFLSLADRADQHLRSPDQGEWLSRLHEYADNIRAALAWALEHDIGRGVEFLNSRSGSRMMDGQLRESIAWLEQALEDPEALEDKTRAWALCTYADALHFNGESDRAAPILRRSLKVFRALGDKAGEARALDLLCIAMSALGATPEAIELAEQALAIHREAGDALGTARTLHYLGEFRAETGDFDRGAAALAETLAIVTELGDQYFAASTLHSLGDVALLRGDTDQAWQHYQHALRTIVGFTEDRARAFCLAGMACAAAVEGDAHTAGRLWSVIEQNDRQCGTNLLATGRQRYERILMPLQHDQEFDLGRTEGQGLSLRQAVDEIVAAHPVMR